MNPFFHQIVSQNVRQRLKKKHKKLTPKQFDKEVETTEIEITYLLRNVFFVIAGVAAASFGLGGFLLPNSFIDGGVTGISLLVEEVTGISLSILLVAINLPFILLGANTIGKRFAIKSILAIALLAFMVHEIHFPIITSDKLLIAVFGGFFLGLGIGLSMRGGAVIDGTEVLAVYISRRTGMSIGDVVLLFNIVIFSFGAYILSMETALYAILTYLVASKTIDFVINGIEEYIGVTIITEHSEDIRLAIIEKLGRACTIYQGKKGYAKRGETLKETDIVFAVITRLELAGFKKEVDKIDKNAFMIMNSIKDTKGGMIKKRPLH